MKCHQGSNCQINRNFINIETISLNLQCSICNEIFNNPMRLDCGHTYCHSCLSNWLRKADQCPNCREKIVESLINRDLLAYNIIMELDVLCNNESKGCPWKGQLAFLVNHMKTCDTSLQILKENEDKVNTNKPATVKKDITPIQNEPFDISPITPLTPLRSLNNVSRSVYKYDTFPSKYHHYRNSLEKLIMFSREKVIPIPILKTEQKKMIEYFLMNNKD